MGWDRHQARRAPRRSAGLGLGIALLLASAIGCSDEPALEVSAWTLLEGAAPRPIRLPTHLSHARDRDPRADVRLHSSVALPPALRDRPLTLTMLLWSLADLRVAGQVARSIDPRSGATVRGLRFKRWHIPAAQTHGETLALELTLHPRWARSTWFEAAPRLSASEEGDARFLMLRGVELVFAELALATTVLVAFIYSVLAVLHRRRAEYRWFALEAICAAAYPAFCLGWLERCVGGADVAVLAALLCLAVVAGAYFVAAQLRLAPPSRAWGIAAAAITALAVATRDPFWAQRLVVPPTVAMLAMGISYQVVVTVRHARARSSRRHATWLLAAWAVLGFGCATDALAWLGAGELLGGLQLSCLGLVCIAVLQAIALNVAHAFAHDRMRRSEANLRMISEMLPLGVAVLGPTGDIRYLNPALRATLAEDESSLLGTQFFELIHADDRATARACLGKLGSASVCALEWRLQRRDGVILSVESAAFSMRFDEAPGVMVTLRDVSEHRRMQGQLMLADRMASVGTLAAGVAHQINNPLAYVMANLEFVTNELRAGTSQHEELVVALTEASDGAERVRRIVRDLKVLSRPDESARAPLDVCAILHSASTVAHNELRHRATVVRQFGEVPPVLANPARLGQVFINLLLNAAHAMPEGHADRNEVRLVTLTDGQGRAVVEIHDTGAGIPPQLMPRIFDPFFSTRASNSGLGLAICHRFISELGGDITVESAPGEGTIVRVALPAAPRELSLPEALGRGERAAAAVPRRLRILVVDDEAPIVRAVSRFLEGSHEVIAAQSGTEALAHLDSGQRFDLILSDVMMPVMSGVELHGEILRRSRWLADRMIFMTGGAFTQRAQQFFERVSNARLQKPFAREELLRVVSAAL